MRCPTCSDARLAPAPTPADSLACPGCAGRWVTADQVRARLRLPPAQAVVPGHALASPRMGCPACRQRLSEFVLPGTQQLVSGCQRCQAVWFDGASWTDLKAAPPPHTLHACPKCHARQASATTCQACGVVFEKFLQLDQAARAVTEQGERHLHEALDALSGFEIRQRLEFLEILSPFEWSNRFDVSFRGARYASGTVDERSDSLLNVLGRQILGGCRPARMDLRDGVGHLLLTMDKPFGLYFHEITVRDATSRLVGTIKRRFHPLRPCYRIRDASGREVLNIRGPWLSLPFFGQHYAFLQQDREVGHLVKRWRGLLAEWFTDTDTFGATLSVSLPWSHKALLFAAVLLIDFGHYENNQKGE